jgi:hypothetical protein
MTQLAPIVAARHLAAFPRHIGYNEAIALARRKKTRDINAMAGQMSARPIASVASMILSPSIIGRGMPPFHSA